MSCPSQAILGQNFTFTLQSYNSNGQPADCDSLPTYKIREEETGTAILSGTMSKLDDAETTGFYSEQIAITSTNGFELYKTYSIRYSATLSNVSLSHVDTFIVIGAAVVPSATSGALTSRANFKEYAGITTNDDDSLIDSLIYRATSAIESYCGRTLRSATHRELYDGTGGHTLYLNQYPITDVSLLAVGRQDVIAISNASSDAYNAYVTVDDTNLTLTVAGGTNDGSSTLTLADYTAASLVTAINNLGAGWTALLSNTAYQYWNANEILPKEAAECLDDYTYLACPDEPEQDYKVYGNAGYLYLPGGFPTGHRNVIVRYTAGYATIPADLEQICIDLVNIYYRSRKTDPVVRSERLGDHAITYDNSQALPRGIAARLAPYRKWRLPV